VPKALILALVLASGFAAAQSPVWPGQGGNLVGYASSPGWPGSFTATACSAASSGTSWADATVTTNCTYSTTSHTTISCHFCIFEYVDFKSSATADNNVLETGNNVLFIGDRFQSNCLQCANVSTEGTNVYYLYSSIVPLVSLLASPPGSVWPSAGAGANSTTITSGTNAGNGNDGYEEGFFTNTGSGPTYIDHCDIWGFADAIQLGNSTTAQITITNNWIHDIVDPVPQTYHTDGIGYLNGNTAPNNVTIIGNTVALLGNTNSMAFQAATAGYQGIFVAENFWSGDNSTMSWCSPGSLRCTNSYLYGNVWGATVAADGPIYTGGGFTVGTGSVWACNTVSIPVGTSWTELNSPFWSPVHSQDGQYFLYADPPNSTTDQGSNTLCGITTPSSINFGTQGNGTTSAGQTVTFYSTNTGNLSISSIALATGTQFSIASNSCGATLNSGSNCSIVVKFAPTGLGPQTDTLKITDNTPGVTSPQLVPLAGIGVTPTQATAPSCTPTSGAYAGTQSVSCTNPNSGTAVMCYTTNGSTPATAGNGTSCTTGTAYTTAISVASSLTLKVIAGTSTLTDSTVTSYSYTINSSAPTCSPTPGTYTGTQSATLTNSNSGTTVACYTTNGSTPATAGDGVTCTTGTAYSGAISVLFTQTIKAIAGTSTLPDSSVTSCAYTINAFPPAASIGMFALLQ
jgi:hypothetical protein